MLIALGLWPTVLYLILVIGRIPSGTVIHSLMTDTLIFSPVHILPAQFLFRFGSHWLL